jgi:hypothetical protein
MNDAEHQHNQHIEAVIACEAIGYRMRDAGEPLSSNPYTEAEPSAAWVKGWNESDQAWAKWELQQELWSMDAN